MTHIKWESVLRCPMCRHGNIKKSKGQYRCTHCKSLFPVRQQIPIFVDFSHSPQHLKKQVLYFEKEDIARGAFTLEPWQKQFVEDFLHYARLPGNSLIIDNATGSGYMAMELAKRGHFVIATDLTLRELIVLQQMLKKLHLEHNVFLVCCSSENLPLRNTIADGMVANAILEHLPREKQAIREIGRVLKPSATLMVAMPIAFRYVFALFWPLNWIHDRKIGHLRRYTRGMILQKFSNFREVTTYYTGHIMKVICVILYFATKKKKFLLDIAERSDRRNRFHAYGASNIVSILKKI